MLKKIVLYGFRKNWRGFGFLIRKVFNNHILVQNKFGVWMNLNPQEIIDSSVILDGYFDEPVLQAILKVIKDDDVVWDIGANIGLHSLSINKLNPRTQCYCFEPHYENFQRLLHNASLNKNIKIHAFNFGLSSDVSMHKIFSTPRNHGRTGFHEMVGTQFTKTRSLAIDGDRLLTLGVSPPNIIKIDTEGHELQVLQGLSGILSSPALRAIAFEVLDNKEALIRLLESHSFKISSIDSQSNFLALRVE